MDPVSLKAWRKTERERLVAARLALEPATLQDFRHRIDTHIERAFPGLGKGLLAICWPFKNEYDPRFLAHRLRERGARTALPVVVAPRQPLIFREWKPGDELATGVYDIPYPATGEPVVPDAALVPMNGFDAGGYRLGYGGGFFDRTLASLRATHPGKPVAIGVTYELARMQSIDPQSYDIPMDYVVTERGVYQRIDGTLELLGHSPAEHAASGYSSPACLAHEIAPGYFGEPVEKPET
ncbi:MAG: 5-formyltetrahydrofolate cyclo-ligase [Betaproteobacteria bacterium]